jgi:hypothetical protein
MRKAINENPMVQIALVGALLLIAALFLLMRSGGGDSGSPAGGQAANPASATAPTGAPASSPAPTGSAPSPAAPASQLAPGPGLPRKVLASYRSGDVVVLLVVRQGGIDDALVRAAVQRLRSEPGVAVFVTDSRHIAGYAAITQGVSVDRTPALVVVKPRSGGGAPQATVSYGFRSAHSIAQTVRDALYKGPERSYDP